MSIRAPWTAEQVEALNRWQSNPRFHPFTCPAHTDHYNLAATRIGWVCTREGCTYVQDWAHDFMASPTEEDTTDA